MLNSFTSKYKLSEEDMEQRILPELLNRQEASSYLRICKTTLDKLKIPRIKIRHKVIYRKQELEQWLINNTQIKEAQ